MPMNGSNRDCFADAGGKLGFGCMRLPLKDGEVDLACFTEMTDAFLDAGFRYFDTAHGYLDGKSETALRSALTSRYPRESYVLTNKLTGGFFRTEADIRPLFEEQLRCCGVEYFDFYLMHAQSSGNYEKYRKCRAYETAFELKKEGRIRHVGISFHDTAEVLDRILTDYPQLETVQIQFNYIDYEDPVTEGRKCYEICRKHGKPIIVMEPVKGGTLAQLPEDAAAVFHALGSASAASYALRYAAGFPQNRMILSGMSDPAQMRENIALMRNFRPLDEAERAAVSKVCRIFRSKNLIACTSCRYCTAGCPAKISIPDLFSCMNTRRLYRVNTAGFYYENVYTVGHGKASDCIRCGKCEAVCPQHLPIRSLLEGVAAEFEAGEEA